MSTVEIIEKNKIKLTFEVTPERFQKGLEYSYNKNKGYADIAGFRKGKAPRKVIERAYGKDYFYDDAINHVLPDAYEQALEQNSIEPVYKPSIRIIQADETNGAVFEAEVYVKPEVSVDGYHGLTYLKTDTEPNEDDIQTGLKAEQEKNARLVSVDRPAENGDTITINFTGYVDGEAFEGGAGTDYDLTLGTHTFIDTFEDQLVGHVPGDDVEVNVTFPEEYNHEALKGKPALFQVEILDIKAKEYPEIDDEFAQDVSEFETLAEYRQDLTEKIRKEKEERADMDKRTRLMEQLVEKAVMDVPEVMYTARIDEMIEELSYRLSQQGMNLDLYMRFTQTTEETLRENYARLAHEEVDGTLALEAVARQENLSVDESEYQAQVEKIAERGNKTAEEINAVITPEHKKGIMHDLLMQKAMEFIVDKAVAVDAL